jgi:pyridoxine 5-phosphate synthase
MPAKLSININKYATLRNSRGGNNPDLLQITKDLIHFGTEGITVHPRPDERHIRYQDVRDLKPLLNVEFNIEGNCQEDKFVQLVLEVKPEQVTLVPDALGQLTSNHGWDTIKHKQYLRGLIEVFQKESIRTSIFVDPVLAMIDGAKDTGTDRIELYTEHYAKHFSMNKEDAINDYVTAAQRCTELELGVNAGHDLNLLNLKYFADNIPNLLEVSIGHALICDAIYQGLQNTVQLYKRCLALPQMP